MAKFQPGQTYIGRFIGDADAIFKIKILSRSAKFVTIEHPTQPGQMKRCGIKTDPLGDGEYILPFGSYSMAPGLFASRPVAA